MPKYATSKMTNTTKIAKITLIFKFPSRKNLSNRYGDQNLVCGRLESCRLDRFCKNKKKPQIALKKKIRLENGKRRNLKKCL